MINVVFFARIREQLGVDALSVDYDASLASVDALCHRLVEAHGESWSAVLQADNVLKAVNQELVDGASPIRDGDEVAFFPPVTGG